MQVLKSACFKLVRLPICKSFPAALNALAVALIKAGMADEMAALSIQPAPPQVTSLKRPSSPLSDLMSAQEQLQAPAVVPSLDEKMPGLEVKRARMEVTAPPDWPDLPLDTRTHFVLTSLAGAAMPPMPFRDPRLRLADPEDLVEALVRDLTGGPDTDLAFIKVRRGDPPCCRAPGKGPRAYGRAWPRSDPCTWRRAAPVARP